MNEHAHKIAEAAPLFTVPAWLVSLAADLGPLINVAVGLLTAATLVIALILKWRELRRGK